MRLLLAAGLAALLALPARAEEPPAGSKEAPKDGKKEEAAERVPTPEETKSLLEGLEAARKKKGSADVLRAIGSLRGLVHRDFLKPLLKLLAHDDPDVAIAAARALDGQKPRGTDEKALEKEVDKAGKDLWKAGFGPPNDKRAPVRAAVVRTFGAWNVLLDERQYDDADKLWRWLGSAPDARLAGALTDLAHYALATKDKRTCRLLAEWLEEPGQSGPITGTTPPASYFEAKWKMWKPAAPIIHDALKAITGQDFRTMEEAKKWFDANRSTFGFKW
jgi:hypothetical protein